MVNRDMTLAKHVMNVHLNATSIAEAPEEREVSLQFLKRFISYARSVCGPRLSESAGNKLKNRYVLMRSGYKEAEANAQKRLSIPITVRYGSHVV